MAEPVRKRFLYLMRQPPHGSIFAQEGLETVLTSGPRSSSR